MPSNTNYITDISTILAGHPIQNYLPILFISMELQLPIVITLLILLLMVIIQKRKKSKIRLPPGPWKLPVIGSLHHLVSGLPHHSLRDLAKKHGPIMHLNLGEISAIVISSPKIAKEVMKTHDLTFADRPSIMVSDILSYNCTDIVFSPYGDYWRQLRKICILELLSVKRVLSFRSVREEEVSNLTRSISMSISGAGFGEVAVNLSEKFESLSNDITLRAAFGKKLKDNHALISLMSQALQLGSGFGVVDLFPSKKFLHVISGTKSRLEKIHMNIDKILNDVLEEHKENKKVAYKGKSEEDLADVLLRLQESGDLDFPITTENIKAVIMDMFFAGSEASATMLEWAMAELMKHPKEMKEVQDEVREVFRGKLNIDEAEIHKLTYLKLVIKETLRLHPPAPLLAPRECREKCEINGYEIPVKTKVIVNSWAIGRDPEYWKNAESFEPKRFKGMDVDYKGTNFEFIPFGAGRRMCPGILFGIATVELPLAQLLYHFDWKLPNGAKQEELDMTESFGGTARPKNNLYFVPTLYTHLPVNNVVE
ncbi:hypothetical protein GIB67_025355 [Kingdonia uniflora]|uniref:Cytochrome P450 n=1 Tax=Kingdonia uniflora TaxID=39325 RepID=A0A7J7NB89_9MAGN|nr:hypothetical protein GIB67_025355 [Kingdonia uniflora]